MYKGQFGDGSFIPCTVEPLYMGQVGDGFICPRTRWLLKGQLMGPQLVPCIERLYCTRDKGPAPNCFLQRVSTYCGIVFPVISIQL